MSTTELKDETDIEKELIKVLAKVKDLELKAKELEDKGKDMDDEILILSGKKLSSVVDDNGEGGDNDSLMDEAMFQSATENIFGITESDEEEDEDDEKENTQEEADTLEKVQSLMMQSNLKGLEQMREKLYVPEKVKYEYIIDNDNETMEATKSSKIAKVDKESTKHEQKNQTIVPDIIKTIEICLISHDKDKLNSLMEDVEQIKSYDVTLLCEMVNNFLNGDYLANIEMPVIYDVLANASNNKGLIVSIQSIFDQFVKKSPVNKCATMVLGASLLHLFIQANWTGPPLSEERVYSFYSLPFTSNIAQSFDANSRMDSLASDARAASAASGKPKEVNDLDKYPEIHYAVQQEMEVSGEMFYSETKYSLLLLASRALIELAHRNETCSLQTSGWWLARLLATHQESLLDKNIAASLKNELDDGLQYTIQMNHWDQRDTVIDNPDQVATRFWVESGVMYHKFNDTQNAKVSLQQALNYSGLRVQLSGALGKRTKFQEEDKSQLILLASSSTTEIEEKKPNDPELKDVEQVEKKEKNSTGTNTDVINQSTVTEVNDEEPMQFGRKIVNGIRTVELEELDEHTHLREDILFKDDGDNNKLEKVGALSPLDQSIVLGLCVDVKNSYAFEPLTAEEMLAYVNRVLQHPKNWMVYSTALLIKSQLEFEKFKTKERAVLQMQILVDQQSDRLTPLQFRKRDVDDSAPAHERLLWIHALSWPPVWSLNRGLASKYFEIGVVGSALEIFTSLKMWEQAVECLVSMGKKNRAETLIKERMEVSPSANLMCVYGNLLDDDASWYEKAWLFSNRRFARAKRLLATCSFKKGDYESCITHLEEALKINPLFPQSWFRLGAAAMRVSKFQIAKNAFSQVVAQEPTDGEAWGNLCAVLVKLNRFEEALNAVCEGVKHSRENWKMWENYVTLSLRTENWNMAINGVSKLIDLRAGLGPKSRKDGTVDIGALDLLTHVILDKKQEIEEQKGQLNETSDDYQAYELLKMNYDQLLQKIIAECKSDEKVWKIMAHYYHGIGNNDQWRDMLLRRFRVLQQIPDWERSQESVIQVASAVNDLYVGYITPDGNEAAPQNRVEEAKSLVSHVVMKSERLFKILPQVESLRTLICNNNSG